MSSPFTQLKSAVNYYVKNICKARLKPLKIMANNASGVVGTVPVLYYGPCIYIITMAFTGRVTLFFASNSETNCRNSMVFQHKASYTPT